MKKLNITKERFEKSNYFKRKYGKLEYVSESGKLFKTNKGKILKFKESRKLAKESSGEVANPDNVQVDDILYCTSYYDFMISTFYKVIEKRGKSTLVLQRLKKNYTGSQSDGAAEPSDRIDPDCKPITVRYGKRGFKIGSNRLYVWDGTPLEEYNYSESRKFGKEIEGADPALICPYCGGNNCEVSIGSDDLNFTNLDRLQGETFNVECWCNDCNKPYNVTVELNVKDVYPNEDLENLDIELPGSELEDDDL